MGGPEDVLIRSHSQTTQLAPELPQGAEPAGPSMRPHHQYQGARVLHTHGCTGYLQPLLPEALFMVGWGSVMGTRVA